MKTFYIIHGAHGAGKSALAKKLGAKEILLGEELIKKFPTKKDIALTSRSTGKKLVQELQIYAPQFKKLKNIRLAYIAIDLVK